MWVLCNELMNSMYYGAVNDHSMYMQSTLRFASTPPLLYIRRRCVVVIFKLLQCSGNWKDVASVRVLKFAKESSKIAGCRGCSMVR